MTKREKVKRVRENEGRKKARGNRKEKVCNRPEKLDLKSQVKCNLGYVVKIVKII